MKKLLEKLHKRKQARKAIKELSALSDYELNDIGINRADIKRVVYMETQ